MFYSKGRAVACLLVSPFGRRKHEACVARLVYLSSLGIKGAVSPLGLTEGSINIPLNKVDYSSQIIINLIVWYTYNRLNAVFH